MKLKHPFEPIIFKDTKFLILGTFPSIKSFKNSFYYSNARNQFWTILSQITNYPINNKEQKIWLLKVAKIGLWDMVASCKRQNSLDSSLREIELNDIEGLLASYPNIKKILFTGRKAQELFEKNFSHLKIERVYLPSPSPAYAKMSLKEKIRVYKRELDISKEL